MKFDSPNISQGPQTRPSSFSSSTTSRSNIRRELNRAYTARTNTPSPLRYATSYSSSSLPLAPSSDIHSSSSNLHPPSIQQPPHEAKQDTQPPKTTYASLSIFQWSKARKTPATLYPVYTPCPIHNSKQSGMILSSSASGGSLHPEVHHSRSPPRTSVFESVTQSGHTKEALMPNRTWHADGPKNLKHNVIPSQTHVSFLPTRRRQPVPQLHPLLAYSRLQRSPIAYDVSLPPSPSTLLDRRTRSPLPSSLLAQTATKPQTSTTLVLKSPKFPWDVVATSAHTESSKHNTREASATSSRSRLMNGTPVTNLDVLHAVHVTLAARVTPQEWAALGHGSRRQQRVMQAYERRCVRAGGGWDEGVRRIDYLCGKTLLVGVEMDKKSAGNQDVIGRLVFAKT